MQFIRKFTINQVFILLLIALFSIVLIFSYSNYPSSDDFGFKYVLDKCGFWGFQKYYYDNWTGRYFVMFLTSLTHPLLYKSYLGYKLVPAITFIVHYTALLVLLRKILNIKSLGEAAGITALIFIVLFASLPSIVDAFFWFPAAWYISALSFNYLFIVTLFRFYNTGSFNWYLFTAFLTIACSGLLEINFVLTAAILFAFIIDDYIRNKKINYRLLVLFIIAACCIAVSVTAPGNINRSKVIAEIANTQSSSRDLNFAILTSIKYLFKEHFFLLIKGPLPWLLLSLFFIEYDKIGKWKCNLHPLLLSLALFGIVFLHYFVFYYASGIDIGLMSRSVNGNIALSVIGMFLLTIYTIKWYNIKPIRIKYLKNVLYIIIILSFLFSPNMTSAYKNIRGRDFIAYHDEMESRIQFIQQNPQDSITVAPLKFFPKWTFYSDINNEFSNEVNQTYAYYWRLKAIRTKE